jgi:hypothetical protein
MSRCADEMTLVVGALVTAQSIHFCRLAATAALQTHAVVLQA